MTTPRYTTNLERARAALAVGFKSAGAQHNAVQDVARAYDELKDIIHRAIDSKVHDELFWSVPDLHAWKPKHAAAIVAVYPGLAATCALVAELVTLRAAIKAAPVVKAETKRAATERKVAAIKEAVAKGVASPIALAIAPLRQAAAASARDWATSTAEKAKIKLAEFGFDPYAAAPDAPHHASKLERRAAADRRAHLARFVTCRDNRNWAWSDVAAQRYVAATVAETEASFDSFVLKLDSKVGAHTAAELIAGATWGYSILRVTLADGAVQHWKTQRIVNCSALGNLFNQWPTRIVK